MAWTKRSIEKIQEEILKDYSLVVVSNAEPYVHVYSTEGIKVARGTGGVITAIEPIVKISGGLWVAHGRGSADFDVLDKSGKIHLPLRSPRYDLKRVYIEKKDLRGWYYGFANETLWPLCHNVFERPNFVESDWNAYVKVNRLFSDAILSEIKNKKCVIWIQDYHFALLPAMIRESAPDALIAHFWHIPWPTESTFQICPWKKEIIEGLLGADLIGFQRASYTRNFLSSVGKTLEAKIDLDTSTVTYNNKISYIRHVPISIDYAAVRESSRKSKNFGKRFVRHYVPGTYEFLSLGVERLDYTKGVLERLNSIDRFLEKYPEYQGRFVHVNILVPSRTLIWRYEKLSREIDVLVQNINFKYRTSSWQPLYILNYTLDTRQLYNFYKSANLLTVTSLADGMNLVAKEYVVAGPDDGSLILSEQTGAADELHDAITVNPYDIERLADSIKFALEMPTEEKKERIRKMREAIAEQNVYWWAGKLLTDLANLTRKKDVPNPVQ
ncbi:trehalose-6-phosphate synthase [Candidatus Parcubacteria bacterium]|nr:trehalose-6-phosphate synthase [Candidatus Parcubacteria bacterium]